MTHEERAEPLAECSGCGRFAHGDEASEEHTYYGEHCGTFNLVEV